MQYPVRDDCFKPIWSFPELIVLNPWTLESTDDWGDYNDEGEKFMKKRLLTSKTNFEITYPEYSLPETNAIIMDGDPDLCEATGKDLYIGLDEPDPADYEHFADVLSWDTSSALWFSFEPEFDSHFGEFDLKIVFQVRTPVDSLPYIHKTKLTVKECHVSSIYNGQNFP